MREFTVHAPAKLNLYLDVLEKRPDGYHNIETLFEKIDLQDEIIIREKGKGIDIKVEPPGICPEGKGNIIYKALRSLEEVSESIFNLEILLRKKIPVSGGLGGGSGDAAVLLRFMNKAFDLGISFERLFSIAAEIGKDVPFFMLDAPFAVGKGAGEELEPIYTDCSFSHIIIKPGVSISSSEMYARLKGNSYESRKHGLKKTIGAIKNKDISLLKEACYNKFEGVLEGYDSYINKAKSLLSTAGVEPAFLSGSGPSVFCILEKREEAVRIAEKIPKGQGMDVFVATSYKGGNYGDNRG